MKSGVKERQSGPEQEPIDSVVPVPVPESTSERDGEETAEQVDASLDWPAPDGRPAEQQPVPVAPVAPAAKRWPLIVLAVLAALGFAGTGYFLRYWLNDRTTSSQTSQVRAATTNFVTALTNFDPGNIDSDFAKVQSLATGTFATQARQYFGSSIRTQLISAHAASRGQIRNLYVESLGGGQASVFVVVDQDYMNSSMTSQVSDTLRLELGLTDTSSGWLISTVSVLESPSGFTGPTPSTSAPSGGKSK